MECKFLQFLRLWIFQSNLLTVHFYYVLLSCLVRVEGTHSYDYFDVIGHCFDSPVFESIFRYKCLIYSYQNVIPFFTYKFLDHLTFALIMFAKFNA
jgi:hypothetical protein